MEKEVFNHRQTDNNNNDSSALVLTHMVKIEHHLNINGISFSQG